MEFDIFFLKSLLSPLIEKKDFFSIGIEKKEENFYEIKMRVSSSDMKRIIGFRGGLYRAIKVIFKYYLTVDSVNLIIDVWDEKKS